MAKHLEVQEASADLRVFDASVRCLVSEAPSETQTPFTKPTHRVDAAGQWGQEVTS